MGSWHCSTGTKKCLFGRLRVSLKRWETLLGGENKNMRSLITVGALSVDGSVSPYDAGNLWVAGKKRKIPLLPTKNRGQRSPWVIRCGGNLIPDPFPGWFSPSQNTVRLPLWCFWGEKLPQEGSPCLFLGSGCPVGCVGGTDMFPCAGLQPLCLSFPKPESTWGG